MKTEKLTEEEEAKLLTLKSSKIKLTASWLSCKSKPKNLQRQKRRILAKPLLEDVKNIRDKMQKEDYAKRGESIEKSIEKDLDSASKEQQNMLKFLKPSKETRCKLTKP